MNPLQEHLLRTRRDFLATSASGLGALATLSLLQQDGLLAAGASADPLAPQRPHFAPRARNCIFLFLAGAPSHLDLYDPKPRLNELNGQKLPESLTKDVRFAFIKKETATLMGSKYQFARHGRCGMELSELLPNLATCADDLALIRTLHTEAFNHHPGQLMMNTGFAKFGRPSVGAWLVYGLGSASRNLPGYVVLWAGPPTQGSNTLWTSGFLPNTYQGVLFRSQGEPVLNLASPPGVTADAQRRTRETLRELNGHRHERIDDPEIAARIASYELAFRMQSAAPELIDLSGETKQTLAAYGVDRPDAPDRAFATNCLLARRLVERGVRFVNLYHSGWDQHANLNRDLEKNARIVDQPVAALLKDLKQRGLLDSTLVVWGAEFGRTPLAQGKPDAPNAGRDHHPFAYAVWMAGGGVKGGQVVGRTDDFGWNPVEEPVHMNDLHATLLHLFGLEHTKLTYRFQGRDFRLTDVAGQVIGKLLA